MKKRDTLTQKRGVMSFSPKTESESWGLPLMNGGLKNWHFRKYYYIVLSVITFLKVWFCSADAGPINTMLFRQVLNRHSRYILKSPSHYNLMPSLDIYIHYIPSISTRLVFKLPLQCNCDMMGLTLGEVQRSFSLALSPLYRLLGI